MRSYGTIAAALTISAYVIFVAIYWVIEGRRRRSERLGREKSPIEDRITAMIRLIRAAAAEAIKNLEEWDPPGSRESDWIIPLLDYYFRLEALAASSSHVISDWEQLAAEFDAFIVDQGLKGFRGAKMATEMVTLLRKRDQI